jgi:hypothetical protein
MFNIKEISLAVYLKIIMPMFFESHKPVTYPSSKLNPLIGGLCLLVTILAGKGVQWLL